jgi:hypothetical protein
MKEIFEKIIKHRLWRDVPCGSGSTVEYTTTLRQSLPDFVAKHNVASMLDLPCGDYSWMSMVDWPENFQYQGADIVEFMINENQQRCPDINFSVMNLCQDTLPQVDLLFCRDCLFHLSFADIKQAFNNISRSKIRWVLTTTYSDVTINTDIKTGDFRPINLELQPFNLPKPVDYLVDYIPNYQARVMALWKQEDFIGKML